jgi:hypothetical protein
MTETENEHGKRELIFARLQRSRPALLADINPSPHAERTPIAKGNIHQASSLSVSCPRTSLARSRARGHLRDRGRHGRRGHSPCTCRPCLHHGNHRVLPVLLRLRLLPLLGGRRSRGNSGCRRVLGRMDARLRDLRCQAWVYEKK